MSEKKKAESLSEVMFRLIREGCETMDRVGKQAFIRLLNETYDKYIPKWVESESKLYKDNDKEVEEVKAKIIAKKCKIKVDYPFNDGEDRVCEATIIFDDDSKDTYYYTSSLWFPLSLEMLFPNRDANVIFRWNESENTWECES